MKYFVIGLALVLLLSLALSGCASKSVIEKEYPKYESTRTLIA